MSPPRIDKKYINRERTTRRKEGEEEKKERKKKRENPFHIYAHEHHAAKKIAKRFFSPHDSEKNCEAIFFAPANRVPAWNPSDGPEKYPKIAHFFNFHQI